MLLILIVVISLAAVPSFAEYLYPCDLSDYQCISSVLASNSDCDTRVWGSIPASITYTDIRTQAPYANITFDDQYSIWRNIDKCYVSAFFFNPTSDTVIMSVDCPNLQVEFNRRVTQRYVLGQERYFRAKATSSMPPISFTVNMPHADDLDLCDAFVYSYVDGIPKYDIVPYDAATAAYLGRGAKAVLNHLSITIREEFLDVGPRLFRLFVSYMLCDFDCNLS